VIAVVFIPCSSNWSSLNTQCRRHMNDMVARYGKEVMIVEEG